MPIDKIEFLINCLRLVLMKLNDLSDTFNRNVCILALSWVK